MKAGRQSVNRTPSVRFPLLRKGNQHLVPLMQWREPAGGEYSILPHLQVVPSEARC